MLTKFLGGGSGYAIHLKYGKEIYDKSKDRDLPPEIESMFPDYSIYGITDTAYGFITKGCIRNCDFCHVCQMQGTNVHKVADLDSFWNGQKNIVLLDPNLTAYCNWKEEFQKLIDSGAYIDFSQGLDIRCMTDEKAKMLKKMKIKSVHFAWDNYDENNKIIKRKLMEFADTTGWDRHKVSVYVLTNFNTSIEQDLERIMKIREMGFQPYVMRYDKEHIERGSTINQLARWVNFIPLFWKYDSFDEYLLKNRDGKNEFKQMTIFDYMRMVNK